MLVRLAMSLPSASVLAGKAMQLIWATIALTFVLDLSTQVSFAQRSNGGPLGLVSPRLRWGMTEAQAEASGARYYNHTWVRARRTLGYPQLLIGGVAFEVELQFNQKPMMPGDENRENLPAVGLNQVSFFKHGECDEAEYFKLKRYFNSRFSVARAEITSGIAESKDRSILYSTVDRFGVFLTSRCDNAYEKYKWLSVDLIPPLK